MIATITLNPAIDKSVIVQNFAIGKTNRVEVLRVDAGGKGINVARALKQLGSEVCALGLVAGSGGRFIADVLEAAGIPADFVVVPGETRINLKVHDPVQRTETELNEAGFHVDGEHFDQLQRKVQAHAPHCQVMIFSGSLPPDAPAAIFGNLIRIANAHGSKCFLDTGGHALRKGIEAGPELIKPNRAEVEELLNTTLRTRREMVEAARTLLRMGSRKALISLGAEGAVAVTENEAWFAAPPAMEVRSSVGAGDTMVAAMAHAGLKGLPFREAFRLAVAASAATTAMEGTKVANLDAAQALLPQVAVEDVTD